ncbi:hypothetical protein LTR91_013121 [Friedmanniomyces endolithicus]|uniref:FAD/NAD(P)-binding domain-containing protein n=1 Tax=Friedmanniomyces endolithicus TaxID=329885 RepID=A0AAN6QQ46_9PEZI|nr:hypothetical protein LTR38_014872 [Friedmanniomyces endolithicus]KAK0811852.1 hypothetical protein LTR59_001790 [Friedmanniomyces endolithicus]KAK0821541.1 hypothetical protein LTR75_000627 [Friedmanniomyces endolithicus]KAK0857348.1 hypothetical protein LTR03_000838 [Friedmanniomyces endolithicus]KAK0863416.1 hypothetical protein LTS02_006630 [Friedmanniomyces endolithicus]
MHSRWSYSALVGSPRPVTMESIQEYVGELHKIDYPRSERVRKRCEEIVKDQANARRGILGTWYGAESRELALTCLCDLDGASARDSMTHLPSFNESNVTLVDTKGKGVEKLTASGPEFDGNVYDVDAIIWGTGFVSPFGGSPAGRAGVQVYGRDGISLEARNNAGDLSTLHGAISPDFPNMFWLGPLQTGVSPNFVFTLDIMSSHVARLIRESEKKVGGKAIIEPTARAVEDWGMEIAMGALGLAGMDGCTPGYLNMEGMVDQIPPEMRMAAARKGIWGGGVEGFCDALESWWAKGGLEGLEVAAAA